VPDGGLTATASHVGTPDRSVSGTVKHPPRPQSVPFNRPGSPYERSPKLLEHAHRTATPTTGSKRNQTGTCARGPDGARTAARSADRRMGERWSDFQGRVI
jgi:hypothetical protein